jgi:Rps23 Pro-64 3,4-dihydroxylase Tpa1-like proline 4-hydroxylase
MKEQTFQINEALRRAHLRSRPWAHAFLPDAISADVAGELAQSFPHEALIPAERLSGQKTYRLATASLDSDDSDAPNSYRALARSLAGADYRVAVTDLIGIDLTDAQLAINVWEYRSGDWLAPHIDKEIKIVTQIIYLSADWRPGCGGRLLIYNGTRSPTTVATAHSPLLGSSAILVRSERSWHAVEGTHPNCPPRRSLTATFSRPD